MPQPKKHESAAARQAAYRSRHLTAQQKAALEIIAAGGATWPIDRRVLHSLQDKGLIERRRVETEHGWPRYQWATANRNA